jgi:hypothetical protein
MGGLCLGLTLWQFTDSIFYALGAWVLGAIPFLIWTVVSEGRSKWAENVLNKWDDSRIEHELGSPEVGLAPMSDTNDPMLCAAKKMASRIEALLEPDDQARESIEAADEQVGRLLEERANVTSTLDGIPSGEGREALESVAKRLEDTAGSIINGLATVYASLVAQGADEDSDLRDALGHLEAEAEVARALLGAESDDKPLQRESPQDKHHKSSTQAVADKLQRD